MNKKNMDERIVLTRRKIQSDAYGWLIMVLMLSCVVQQFFMKAPFSQYAVEFFAWIGSGLYISIRHYKEGIDIWGAKHYNNKKLVLNIIISGVISLILFAVLSGISDKCVLAFYFMSFVTFFLTSYSIIMSANRKKQQAIENRLDQEEMKE